MRLSRTVLAHQALDGRFFIAGIVVDMRIRVTLKVRDDPVDELLERDLFFVPAVRPKSFEGLFTAFVYIQAEEVLQATLLQRITFHIEEQITLDCRRHTAKATPRPHDRQQLVQRGIAGAPLKLQARLMA